jgi:hypothetical protein
MFYTLGTPEAIQNALCFPRLFIGMGRFVNFSNYYMLRIDTSCLFSTIIQNLLLPFFCPPDSSARKRESTDKLVNAEVK